MRNVMLRKDLFIKNRNKLTKLLGPNSLVIIASNNLVPRNGDQNYPFRQNSDFFYLTGIDQENTILVMCPDHQNISLREILFIQEMDEKTRVWTGSKYSTEEAAHISGIKTIKWVADFDAFLPGIISSVGSIYLYINEKLGLGSDFISANRKLTRRIQENYPLHQYFRLAPLIAELRLVKEDEELEVIKEACAITKETFKKLIKSVKPGKKEYELEAEMTYEFLKAGADGHAFEPIIASGENACILHYTKNNDECKDGELVLFDFGAELSNYAADCSRTIPVNGKFTDRQRELYEAVLAVFRRARKVMLPGTTINEINSKVEQWWQMKHIELGLYTREDLENQDPDAPLVKKYFPHGNSHFLGLDVHDVGDKDIKLKPGMVLTCEPGIYIPEEKIGIRIENDILVTEDEPRDLMVTVPYEIEEIERLMENSQTEEG